MTLTNDENLGHHIIEIDSEPNWPNYSDAICTIVSMSA